MANFCIRNCIFKKVMCFQSVRGATPLCLPKRMYWGMNWDYYGKRGPKGEYSTAEEKFEQMPRMEIIRNGFKIFKEELQVWKEEMIEKWRMDPYAYIRPHEIDIAFRFDSEKDREKWIVTTDADNKEGFSNCTFTPTPYGTVLFSGNISTRVPQDGIIKRAGYCNITSERKTRSFLREDRYNWLPYTYMVFKVRGDGRSYMINLLCPGRFDLSWHDAYHYILHTRGGPYWQLTKIPFSKFYFAAKGRIQDIQHRVLLSNVANMGITIADGIDGPFNLEIDYIGLEFDPDFDEDFAYEMYKQDKFIAKY